jgi:uncharacterized protein YjbJ (UPF0337 family)
MGFLDKLLGRTKDVADSAVDKARDVVPDNVENAVGGAVDKVQDVAGDAADKARDVIPDSVEQKVGETVDKSQDTAGDVKDKVTGADEPSPPSAAS